jgi:hypothetical protein
LYTPDRENYPLYRVCFVVRMPKGVLRVYEVIVPEEDRRNEAIRTRFLGVVLEG